MDRITNLRFGEGNQTFESFSFSGFRNEDDLENEQMTDKKKKEGKSIIIFMIMNDMNIIRSFVSVLPVPSFGTFIRERSPHEWTLMIPPPISSPSSSFFLS